MASEKSIIAEAESHAVNDPLSSKADRKKSHKKRKGDQDGSTPKKKRRTGNAAANPNHSYPLSQPLFFLETYSLWLPVSPVSYSRALEGSCAEYLSPLLLTYYQPFRGIVLSYENARLSDTLNHSASVSTTILAKSSDEYAGSFVWLTADFVIFRPRKGASINGWVNIQAQSHLSLICWNLFNASIPRKRLPRDWTWKADPQSSNNGDGHHQRRLHTSTGHFVNAAGEEVREWLNFRIQNIEAARTTGKERGFVSIHGTLLDD
ncbi:hypothetical protein EV356DRAFT_502742 [Viridothelium virens]|uniref:DNA-directed RNA polymerase subunit n=1 Tax=Viridothelium virens TaxID=1048519 RepID=A0A6A6H8W1_VIRVR|nr:hypothetical protein EV356DRAFT_502742 [Viridothelium virens]